MAKKHTGGKSTSKLPDKGAPRPGKPGGRPGAAAAAEAGMDVYDRIAWTCLHILVVLVPLAMSNLGPFNINGVPLTYDQFDIAKVFVQRGLVLVALGAWGVGMLVRGGKVRFTRVEWLVLAFLGWLVLTTVFSVHVPTAVFGKYRRYEGLISFLTYMAVFFTALQYADRPSRIRALAGSLAVGGFLVSTYGVIQVIGTVPMGLARVLEPGILVLGLGASIAAVAYAFTRASDDAETRRVLLVGSAIAFIGGIALFAGLGENIAAAAGAGLDRVSLDPVRWGQLPFETNRAFSTFGNPDLLGGYLIFPWAITIGLALSEKHRVWRSLFWVFTVFNAFVGITSYVRGAWIAATVSLGVMVYAYFRARAGTDMRLEPADRVFVGGAVVVAGAAVVASSLRPDSVRNVLTRVQSIFEFDQGSALTRFQIWEAARAAIAERPILGWGADTFRLLFPMFKPAEYVEAAGYQSVADNVHNYPLQLASGVGIPGALLLYGLIGWALLTSAKDALVRGRGPERLLLAGFWAAVLGYVVHLLFGLSVTGATVFLWISMGVLLSPGAHARDVAAPGWRAVGIGVIVALVLAGSVLNIRYVVADNHYLKGRVLTQGLTSIAELERAVELNPYNDMYRLEIGAAWQRLFRSAARQYREQLLQGAPDEATYQQAVQYLGEAEQGFRDTIAFVPNEYDTYVFLTNLYNEAAAYIDPTYTDDAITIGELGVMVEPFGPAVRVQLGIAYLDKGEVAKAIEHLEVATSLDSRYAEAWVVLGEAYLTDGRLEDARAAVQHVLERDPDNTDALAVLQAIDAGGSATPTTTP